jgi:uncharacterized membrane protein (Fun14 family)
MSETEMVLVGGGGAYVWRPWKVLGVAVAGLLVIAGGALALFGGDAAESPAVATGGGDPSSTGPLDTTAERGPGADRLLPGSSPTSRVPSPDEPTPEDPWPVSGTEDTPPSTTVDSDGSISPALLRGGISFFAAFAVGFAFRTFVRIALIFVGIWAISLFLLAQAGWLTVHWVEIDGAFKAWASGIGDQFESFGRFVTGSLPSTGLAGLGLYTGLKRG